MSVVITADMVLRDDGRLRHTRTCWTCRHRIHYTPEHIAKLPTRPYEHEWRVRCERAPTREARHVMRQSGLEAYL